jgi:cleavage stimulation factor subunit 3
VEYHITKKTAVASRIFEKGLEQFGDEIEYVLRYLQFLISVNDDNSQFTLLSSLMIPFLTVASGRCTRAV